jgi:hypothetical protein
MAPWDNSTDIPNIVLGFWGGNLVDVYCGDWMLLLIILGPIGLMKLEKQICF